jgi:hypothetical protein
VTTPVTISTAPDADNAGAVLVPIYGWRATVLLNARPELSTIGNRGAIVDLAVAAC